MIIWTFTRGMIKITHLAERLQKYLARMNKRTKLQFCALNYHGAKMKRELIRMIELKDVQSTAMHSNKNKNNLNVKKLFFKDHFLGKCKVEYNIRRKY